MGKTVTITHCCYISAFLGFIFFGIITILSARGNEVFLEHKA